MDHASLLDQIRRLYDRDVASVRKWEASLYDELAGPRGGEMVLFGAGVLGKIVVDGLAAAGVKPVAFADNNPGTWGTQVKGIPVMSPADAVKRFGTDVPFVVTIYTGAVVQKQLKSMGLRVVPFAPLLIKYAKQLIPRAGLDLPSHMYDDVAGVEAGAGIWADDRSRREYFDQVRYRLKLESPAEPFSPPDATYFPEELVRLIPTERFLDCGAFDGDSVRAFLKRSGPTFAAAHAIEPDPDNCRRLSQFIAGLPADYRPKIHVHNCAAGARREVVHFDATGTAASQVGTGGKIAVQCETIDGLLGQTPPTYVKMDIEGAEPDALRGAAGVIGRHAPVLAICLYHRQDDLWKIPLYIRSLSDKYKLFLRRYSDDLWEQVVYAIPADRLAAGAISAG